MTFARGLLANVKTNSIKPMPNKLKFNRLGIKSILNKLKIIQ
ncbi:hypothetical protein FQV37_824 [Psychrobacter nivimaris]|uniref:Uncharacterized protein n=1 Tax=Psychrobacter nivimaris TaxID=281738 RepID=A0A6N7BZB0_9GAMM|nr:hypothetical protein FQV37_824 [Psychrobacter nivimaris]